MQIRNRLFPYPVLHKQKELSSFGINCNYELNKTISEDNEKLIIDNVCVNLISNELRRLLAENKIQCVLVIECSSTVYRKYYDIGINPMKIELSKSDFKDNVEISSFIYAKDTFEISSSEFLDEYSDYTYVIDKYDVLAIDNGVTIKIKYDEERDNKISSIFSVIKDEDTEYMKIEANQDQIYIYLPEKPFNCYDRLKDMEYYQNEFFAILAIPALTYSLNKVRNDYDSCIEDIRFNVNWFDSFVKAYSNKFGEELTDDIFRDIDTLNVSQIILNNGVVKSIEELFERDSQVGGNEDEQD